MKPESSANQAYRLAACLSEEVLFAALDEQGADTQHSATLAHAASCDACSETLGAYRDMCAKLRAIDTADERMAEGVRREVVRRVTLEASRLQPARRNVRIRRALIGLALAASVFGGGTFGLNAYRQSRIPQVNEAEFAARGDGLPKSLAQRTSISLYALRGEGAVILHSGSRVSASTAFVGGYRNIGENPIYLAVCIVDARSQVHWLYPSYLDANEYPISFAVSQSLRETLLPSSVGFNDMAIGEARVIAIRSEQALSIRELDALPPATLTLAELGTRYQSAVISELKLEIE